MEHLYNFGWVGDPAAWVALATLVVLEIVLGVDNIIFISITCDRLPEAQRARARNVGLLLALFMRIAFLSMITWIMALQDNLTEFTVAGHEIGISWRDIILIGGGLFLLGKGTREIHHSVEGDGPAATGGAAGFIGTIGQILVLDLVFSIDSVVTAVGMVDPEWLTVMILAVVISILVMMLAAGPVAAFINRYPTTKMLALAFLLLIGVTLVADGLDFHVPKGYIYFAVFFSMGVEFLNQMTTKKKKPA